MVDDQETGGRGAEPGNPSEEMAQAAHEIAEALTALGNFIAAARQIAGGADPPDIDIHKVLEGASGQHERAAAALHRLQHFLTRQRR